eukprot:Gb_09821 [translate_table: standard]
MESLVMEMIDDGIIVGRIDFYLYCCSCFAYDLHKRAQPLGRRPESVSVLPRLLELISAVILARKLHKRTIIEKPFQERCGLNLARVWLHPMNQWMGKLFSAENHFTEHSCQDFHKE